MNQFTASLWGDEGWAATLAVQPIWQIITKVAHDTSPPFYYLCLHAWMKIFGTSEVAIRSLSFLFWLGTAITVFFIGKLFWDKKTALLAGLLTLTSPFLFTYAFEGRMYSALLFTSTLSIYFFLKKQKLGFILATTAALYSHHFSIFVIFWEFIWRTWENRHRLFKKDHYSLLFTPFRRNPVIRAYWNTFFDFLIIALFYLPWLYPLYYQTSLVAGGFWLGKPTLSTLTETIRKFVIGSGEETLRIIAGYLIVTALILRKWLVDKEKSVFLLGWFFTPLLVTFFLSQVMQSIFFDRYMLVAIPASSLLIASLRRKISIVPILVAVGLLVALNYQYFIHPTKRPFRDLANYVKTEAADLTLINYNGSAHHLWESKYYGLKAPLYAPTQLPFYVGTALMEKGDTVSELPDKPELGVITSASPNEVNLPGYKTEKVSQFGELKFLRMKKITVETPTEYQGSGG